MEEWRNGGMEIYMSFLCTLIPLCSVLLLFETANFIFLFNVKDPFNKDYSRLEKVAFLNL